MKCIYPNIIDLNSKKIFGCGQCVNCRINQRRVWASRITLESLCHDHTHFITLTYADEFVTESLQPWHISTWLNRFRTMLKREYGHNFRFFVVGEYGDKTERPHYHAVIFTSAPRGTIQHCVDRTWTHGFNFVGEDFTAGVADYVAGYVTKKLTHDPDDRLQPEFIRVSKRPGLGVPAIDLLCSKLTLPSEADVPIAWNFKGRKLPFGNFLRTKMREHLGVYDLSTGEIGKAPRPYKNESYDEAFLELIDQSIPPDVDKYQYLSSKVGEHAQNQSRRRSVKNSFKRSSL